MYLNDYPIKENPQVKELMEAFEKFDMTKEKQEVQSLVDYIGDMENTLSEMMSEISDMRNEIQRIHDGLTRHKCMNLVGKLEDNIKQGIAVLGTVKDNLIRSAGSALKTIKESGKEALKTVLLAMKIPESLDKLGELFGKKSLEIKEDVQKINAMQSELNSAKGHMKNVGRLFAGKEASFEDHTASDKGILASYGRFLNRIGNGLTSLKQKAMDASDKIRVGRVKESVKDELQKMSGLDNGSRSASEPLNAR